MSNDAVVVDFIHKVVEVEFDKDITMAATRLMEAAADAAASAVRAETWAEGTDEQVGVLGGEHSAKGWAEVSGSYANAASTSAGAAKASEAAAAQSAAEAAGINYLVRKNNTTYAAGVVAFYQTIPSPLVLECTTAGTTAATAPDFSGAVENDTITDGTAVWTYKSLLSGAFDSLLRKNSTAYVVGDLAFSASLPSNLVLECTTAGTTAASEPDFSSAVEDGTVTDGTVIWTYKALVSDGGGGGGFNTREEITTSGTWTAPATGVYRVTCIGGGGAGGNGGKSGTGGVSGTQGGTTSFGVYVSAAGGHSGGAGGSSSAAGGGAAGNVVTDYVSLTENDSISVTIGAGGVAPSSGYSSGSTGANGSGGAIGGASACGGAGGSSIYGSGGNGCCYMLGSSTVYGAASGGGFGGSNGTLYGGGGGGGCSGYNSYSKVPGAPGGGNGQAAVDVASGTYPKGGDGGNGAVIIEYFKKEEE